VRVLVTLLARRDGQWRRDGCVWRVRRGRTTGVGTGGRRASGRRRTTATLVARGSAPSMHSGVIVVIFVLVLGGPSRLVADGKSAWEIVGWGRATRDHGSGGATNGRTNRHAGRKRAVGGIEAGLDEVLALGLGDEGLELGGGEGIDEACL